MLTLHELVAVMDGYADALLRRDYGLSFNEFEYLAALVNNPGADVTDVASCLRLTKAAVSKRLPALEAAGLVRRTSDPGHGRRVLTNVTELGAARYRAAAARLADELGGVLNDPVDGHEVQADRLTADLMAICSRIKKKELSR